MTTTHQPRWLSCAATGADDQRRKKTALVMTAISQSNAFATTAPTAPIGSASAVSSRTRRSVLKSASRAEPATGAWAVAEEEECGEAMKKKGKDDCIVVRYNAT